jgi:excisionase family DNA binding protein
MSFTLATAAEAAGVAKPTMWRWIKAGRLSAARLDDGSFRIDPAELERFLSTIKETPAPQRTETQAEAPIAHLDTTPEGVALRSEIEKLKALLEAEKQRAEEWKLQADRWAQQAERLAIPGPVPVISMQAPQSSERHASGWWPFRRAG